MSANNRTDQLYRDALGWPIPPKPGTPAQVIDDLRALLADLRRRRERQHPKTAGEQ